MTTTTAAASATLTDLSGSWTIDPSHSTIGFVARHAMVTKVRGAFNEFEGNAVVNDDDTSRSQVSVVIQVKSIDTRNEQRDEHLRSNEFFAMDDFPQITFSATEVSVPSATNLELTGDLTIKGTTRTVTVPFEFQGLADDPFGNRRAGFEGSITINRKDYGVTWNAALESGGVLVSDKIALEFEISAIKKS